LPAAAGGGQKSVVPLRGTAGGQKFLSPKTPFLFACLLRRTGENLKRRCRLRAWVAVDNSIFLSKNKGLDTDC